MWRLLISGMALSLTAQQALAQEGRVQRGFTFARVNCSQCHAIGRVGESPMKDAPPFRTLQAKYPIESLAEALAEGIVTGHPSMPQFQLDPAQVNDVIAYLKSVQDKP
jgi:mono/diheme cytochrome c family protein